MRSSRWTLGVGVASATFASACALACGMFFPWQLLDNRSATLRDLPVDIFFFQATHLLPHPDPLLHYQAPADTEAESSCAALSDPTETAAGGGVPPVVSAYKAGAAAFDRGDLAAAAARFRDALSVGTATAPGTVHAVCAAFMLGRILSIDGDPASARAAFLRTRALASRGAPDPLGLAVASFGEQARLALDESGLAVGVTAAPEPVAPSPERLAALHRAVTLYSQQAAYGAWGGVSSLQEVAEALFSPQPGAAAWFDAAAADPRIRQVLVAFALADTPAIEDEDHFVPNQLSTSLDSGPVTARLLDRLAPVFVPDADPRDAGRLAAVAYIAGRYDLAARFAASPEDPLSAWIRAKLSLQHDYLAASTAAFATAVRLAEAHPDMIGETGDRLRAEPAVIAVGRGDFQQAMRLLYHLGPAYWGDVAYVAERLLTTDELERFVAGLPPVVWSSTNADKPYPTEPVPFGDDGFRPDLSIRELLARRLMRDGRFAQAASVFLSPTNRRDALCYASAITRSRQSFWRTDRARGAWDAAVLERRQGMALFATEIGPDQRVSDGDYDSGYGPAQAPTGALVTGLERQRYAASAPQPDRRFHYRFQAASEAERAASLLPPRSQAYAAVLCAGARWLDETDDDAGAARLYRLYVARGALLPKGVLFGASCPAPDFEAARRLRWTLPLLRVGWSVSRHWRGLVYRLGGRPA